MTSSIRRALAARSCSAVTAPSLGGHAPGHRERVPHAETGDYAARFVSGTASTRDTDDLGLLADIIGSCGSCQLLVQGGWPATKVLGFAYTGVLGCCDGCVRCVWAGEPGDCTVLPRMWRADRYHAGAGGGGA